MVLVHVAMQHETNDRGPRLDQLHVARLACMLTHTGPGHPRSFTGTRMRMYMRTWLAGAHGGTRGTLGVFMPYGLMAGTLGVFMTLGVASWCTWRHTRHSPLQQRTAQNGILDEPRHRLHHLLSLPAPRSDLNLLPPALSREFCTVGAFTTLPLECRQPPHRACPHSRPPQRPGTCWRCLPSDRHCLRHIPRR